MPHINLTKMAENLPEFWKSKVIGQSGNCNIKILKMDGQQIPDETHDYNEALIVIRGEMFLRVAGFRRRNVSGPCRHPPRGCRRKPRHPYDYRSRWKLIKPIKIKPPKTTHGNIGAD